MQLFEVYRKGIESRSLHASFDEHLHPANFLNLLRLPYRQVWPAVARHACVAGTAVLEIARRFAAPSASWWGREADGPAHTGEGMFSLMLYIHGRGLDSADPGQRSAAISRLARSASPRAASWIAELLGDPDYFVHQEAQRALVKMGRAAVPALLSALEDDNPVVRELAIEALSRLGSRRGRDAIAVLQHNPDAGLRHCASRATKC